MDYFINYKSHETKLAELLTEHGLVHTFRTGAFPITLTISHNAAPEEQMSMLLAEGSNSSPDAKLVLIMDLDGSIEVNTYERLVISDKLFSKIKTLAKKMKDSYCYAHFADTINSNRIIQNMAADDTRFDDFYTDQDGEDENLPVVDIADIEDEEEVADE